MNENQALEWIANLFEVPPSSISLETPRDDIDAWDSLGVLNLIASLDEDFEITIEDSDLEEMKHVKDIVNILKINGKLQ